MWGFSAPTYTRGLGLSTAYFQRKAIPRLTGTSAISSKNTRKEVRSYIVASDLSPTARESPSRSISGGACSTMFKVWRIERVHYTTGAKRKWRPSCPNTTILGTPNNARTSGWMATVLSQLSCAMPSNIIPDSVHPSRLRTSMILLLKKGV